MRTGSLVVVYVDESCAICYDVGPFLQFLVYLDTSGIRLVQGRLQCNSFIEIVAFTEDLDTTDRPVYYEVMATNLPAIPRN